jgi:hypothetical protein
MTSILGKEFVGLTAICAATLVVLIFTYSAVAQSHHIIKYKIKAIKEARMSLESSDAKDRDPPAKPNFTPPTSDQIKQEANKQTVPLQNSVILSSLKEYEPARKLLEDIENNHHVRIDLVYSAQEGELGSMESDIRKGVTTITIRPETVRDQSADMIVSAILHELNDITFMLDRSDPSKWKEGEELDLALHGNQKFKKEIESLYQQSPELENWFWGTFVRHRYFRDILRIKTAVPGVDISWKSQGDILDEIVKNKAIPEGLVVYAAGDDNKEPLEHERIVEHMRDDAATFIAAILREHGSYSLQVKAAQEIQLAAENSNIKKWAGDGGIVEHIIKNRASYGADRDLIDALKRFLEKDN